MRRDRRFTLKISFIESSSKSDHTKKEQNKRRARTRYTLQVLSVKLRKKKKKTNSPYKEISASRAVNVVASGHMWPLSS